MPRLAFDDFAPGATTTYGDLAVDEAGIVAFAKTFDPQVFHVDPVGARDSFVGELIASGWHSCALMMRLLAEHTLLDSTSMGAPGVEEVRWLRPVRPGDRLHARQTVLETKASRSRPEMGLVRFRFELLNQAGEPVMEQTNWIMFGRRGADWQKPGTAPRPSPADAASAPPPVGDPLPSFDEVQIGTVTDLGATHFSAEEILAFARAFDPQPFHTDSDAAARSHFGALCASGWHTGAAWMRRMVDHRQALTRAAEAQGRAAPRLGPSPGFTDLRWLKPVYAGDTIRYASTVTDKRAVRSRPGWGLVFNENTGVNQRGEEVFRFKGCVFWERRAAE